MLSDPGKVYGRILTEKLMEIAEKPSKDQGGFRTGKDCMDEIVE